MFHHANRHTNVPDAPRRHHALFVVPTGIFVRALLMVGLGPLTGCLSAPGNSDACPAPEPTSIASTVRYSTDVRPLLSQKGCLSAGCHGGFIQSSSFDLRSYGSTFIPGQEASVFGICPVVPGDPDSSYIIEKLGASPRSGRTMPLQGTALSNEEIDLIRTWIQEGAQDN